MSAATTPIVSSDSIPPGPLPRAPGLGSLGYYLRFAIDPIGFVRERFEKYGDVYFARVRGADDGLFVIRRPEHLKEVLVTRASSFTKEHSAFKSLSRFLGTGLLASDGEDWTRQRRMVAPAFQPSRLAGYAAIMSEEAIALADRWKDGARVEMGREMMELTLQVVSRTLFGHDVRSETEGVARAMSTFQTKISRPDLMPQWFPSPTRRELRSAIDTIDRIIFGMIERRRTENAEGRSAPHDLLQMLLTAVDEEGDGSKMSEQEVRDQLVTLFLAGHETTSHALTWTLYLLSQNPAAAVRLREELDAVLDGRPATFEDLPKLVYTEQVLQEAMRLYPPVFSVARRAKEDTEIGGYRVPAGSEVMLWIYFTHRDARWFPDPTAFRPERFEPESEAKIPRYAYMPFGAGPRACIGKSFAMMEAKLILATLAARYSFELARGHRVIAQPRITLVPKHGMKMILRARESGR